MARVISDKARTWGARSLVERGIEVFNEVEELVA